MAKEKDKTLTTRFDSQTMAELNVSADVLGFRSLNALVHQVVMQKIREAKAQISAEEFSRLVEAQKRETNKRSRIKSKERLEMLGELVPDKESDRKSDNKSDRKSDRKAA